MNRWLIIHTPLAVHCWPVGPAGTDIDEDTINAARVVAGFPPTDDPRFDIQVSDGEPHHTLLAQATIGTLDELRQVPAAAVRDHANARAQAAHDALVAAAVEHLTNLPTSVLQAVMRHPDVKAGPNPKGAAS